MPSYIMLLFDFDYVINILFIRSFTYLCNTFRFSESIINKHYYSYPKMLKKYMYKIINKVSYTSSL